MNEVFQPGSLDKIATEFHSQIYAFILSRVEDRAAAADLTQDRQELAERLGISLSAAKSRVHRGRAKLRKVVDECCRLITDPYGRVIDWERRALKCCGPDRPRKAVLEHNQTRKST